jgi:hypothetical protein
LLEALGGQGALRGIHLPHAGLEQRALLRGRGHPQPGAAALEVAQAQRMKSPGGDARQVLGCDRGAQSSLQFLRAVAGEADRDHPRARGFQDGGGGRQLS